MTQAIQAGEIDRLTEVFQRLEDTRLQTAPLLTDPASPTGVRSFVSRWVVIGFVLFIAAFALFVMFGGDRVTTEKTSLLMEIAKSLILPVVTFVIGHYFGSKTD